MKTVKINNEEKVMFRNLDPFGYLENEEMENELVLGIADDGEVSDIPVGLMFCCYDETMFLIRWIYVAPEYRGNGYGDELLSAAFTAAENAGIPEVGALITKDEDRDKICPDEEAFLKFHGFDKEVELSEDGSRMFVAEV